MIDNNFEEKFIEILNSIDSSKRRSDIFHYFIVMSAFSIFNVFAKDEKIEQEYLEVVNKYSKDDVNRLAELLTITVLALETTRSNVVI